ncbi:MAG: VOC family protein [Acidimicrobiia bacterium]
MANVTGLHHVAFAHDTGGDTHQRLAELLGIHISHVEEGEGFIERMTPVGSCHIQTLEATGPGVVKRFVDRRGPGLHHVALEVDDIQGFLARLRSEGVQLVDEQPRPGGMGTEIAFIHPSVFGGLLVELVQQKFPRDGEKHP